MTTMATAQGAPDVHRTVTIDHLFLGLNGCARCQGTDANLDTALDIVEQVVRATGTEVELRRIQVLSVQQARELRFEVSPTIRVNGRDIALDRRESSCGPDGCGCGGDASCRVWTYRGSEYTAAPVGLIVDAILTELHGGTRSDEAVAPYRLPEQLGRLLAASPGGCCG
jgi:uncharacterized protein DUF2703